ncbi:UNVERIFIED_CONTAM: hypothetical protein HDU68_006305, partial [Siphonaria sp. JEL0065]
NDVDAFNLILKTLSTAFKAFESAKLSNAIIPVIFVSPVHTVGEISFPKPLRTTGGDPIPFKSSDFKIHLNRKRPASRLPKDCRRYESLVQQCIDSLSHISFHLFELEAQLTIEESWVEPGKTQRTPGLHTERSGKFLPFLDPNDGNPSNRAGEFLEGVFLASNIANSCRVWPCWIDSTVHASIAGPFGEIEHLRRVLDEKVESVILKKNTLVRIADTTPHQALPLETREFRQFFRLTVGRIKNKM